MRYKRTCYGLLISVLWFGLIPAGWAATLSVPSAQYPNILSALQSASHGDVIEVGPGLYIGNLTIDGDGPENTKITLNGSAGAKIKGSITISNANVEINGFDVRRTKSSVGEGIVLQGAHGSIIRNCYIHDFRGSGILMEATDQALVENNIICGNESGVACSNSTGIVVRFNTITCNRRYGVLNLATDPSAVVDASSNWWGNSMGTGTEGDGVGENASANVIWDNDDDGTQTPSIEIVRAYVTNLPDGNTAYKGNSVDFVLEYVISGGSEYGKYMVRSVIMPDWGLQCLGKKDPYVSKQIVGPGLHTVTVTKKVPFCADDISVGVSIAGVPYTMEGNWVDMKYRVNLIVPCGTKLGGDGWNEEAVFLVKKPF